MANTILIKRGQQADLAGVTLQEGELALAYNSDKTEVKIYAGGKDGQPVCLNEEVDLSGVLQQAGEYTDSQISALVDGAPEAMNTLKELADAISENSDLMTALNSAIGGKVDKVSGKGLSTNDYTTAEKTKLAGLSNYTHPASHPASMITQDSSHRFVSDTEKASWNAKLSSSSTVDGGTF